MIPGLKIEFMKNSAIPETYSPFIVDGTCSCYWIDGRDQILIIPKNMNSQIATHSILISFDFKKCLDPDGGHEWLDKKLKRLIIFLLKLNNDL